MLWLVKGPSFVSVLLSVRSLVITNIDDKPFKRGIAPTEKTPANLIVPNTQMSTKPGTEGGVEIPDVDVQMPTPRSSLQDESGPESKSYSGTNATNTLETLDVDTQAAHRELASGSQPAPASPASITQDHDGIQEQANPEPISSDPRARITDASIRSQSPVSATPQVNLPPIVIAESSGGLIESNAKPSSPQHSRPKPRPKAKSGAILKDTGHQTARQVICRTSSFALI